MANEKMLNTRIQLKYDSYDKWKTSTVILKPGEVAIAYLTTDYAVAPGETDFQQPVLFKVGDGDHKFDQLPWASALAADVYAWAKAESVRFNPDQQRLEFYTGDTIIHAVDLSAFVTHDELDTILENYLSSESKDFGKVTADSGSIEADAFHDEFSIKGNGIISTSASGNVITISADLSDYALKDEIPSISPIVIVDDTEVEEPTSEFVDVYKNLTASEHTLTEELVKVPTQLYVDNKISEAIAGAVDYLGTVDGIEALKALNPQNKGDFARVSVSFDDYHASDMLICETLKSEGVDATWSVIHGEIDANDWVANAKEAAGYVAIPVADRVWGADDEGNPSWMQVQTAQIADGAVTEEKLADEVINKFKTVQSVVSDPIANGKALAFIDSISQDENGEITVSKKEVDLPTVNDGKLNVSALDPYVLDVETDKQFSANAADDTTITIDIKEKGIQNKHIADKTISAEKTKAYVATVGDVSEEVWVFYCGTSTELVD